MSLLWQYQRGVHPCLRLCKLSVAFAAVPPRGISQPFPAQGSTAQRRVAQHSTAQHSAAQHSTARFVDDGCTEVCAALQSLLDDAHSDSFSHRCAAEPCLLASQELVGSNHEAIQSQAWQAEVHKQREY